MRGLRIVDVCQVETCDWPDPVPEGDEVVVRLEAAPICGSDLHGLYNKPGGVAHIPGHEGAGVVVAVDRPGRFTEGDRVCTMAFNPCGECDLCLSGYVAYCRQMKGIYGFGENGMQAEYVRIATAALMPLPDAISFEQGCLVIDPVGTPYHAHKRIGTDATHTVGVFGLGPMGLGATVIAAFLGAHVIGIDPIAFRRDLAEKLGAAQTIDPTAGDVVAQIRELTSGRGLDRTLECSGTATALRAALDLTRPLGHVAIIGENPEATIRPSDHFNRKEISLSGSCCFPLGEYDDILHLYTRGLPATDMITHRFPLDQAAEAYRTFAEGNTGKVIFTRQ